MYEQFKSMKSLGPLRHLLKMVPGLTYNVPEDMMEMAEDRLEKWRVIIESMTPEERKEPKMFTPSRIRRVARGSGTNEKEVRELLKQYKLMKKMMKTFRRKGLPLLGRKFPTR